ncbi:hypothetical protein THRCLA_21752 [Thraustotheca clavata]|uniref:Uncharacterized protein n=1 Tax=Thraustotheca clavata TaxID=74557 RepID=A0A1V9ZQ75_9STRA|nr:hypothetical protein THRCLA_21752 [Thraustotheca clavata]
MNEEVNESIKQHSWTPNIGEDSPLQQTCYLNYFKQNLESLLKSDCYLLENATNDQTLLTFSDQRLPFAVQGTTDIILAQRCENEPPSMLYGLYLTIKL